MLKILLYFKVLRAFFIKISSAKRLFLGFAINLYIFTYFLINAFCISENEMFIADSLSNTIYYLKAILNTPQKSILGK